jgi:hypothetical protein
MANLNALLRAEWLGILRLLAMGRGWQPGGLTMRFNNDGHQFEMRKSEFQCVVNILKWWDAGNPIWSSSSFVCFHLFSRNCWRRLRNSNLWIGWPMILEEQLCSMGWQHPQEIGRENGRLIDSRLIGADRSMRRGIARTCLPTFCKSSSQDIRVGKGGG